MGKTAFIFPGQGAQYVGMAQDFYETCPVCREVFNLASEAAGLDVAELCFTENERLHRTEYTQIAMVAAEIAIWRAAEEKGLRADAAAGLSLGEYAALAVSGGMQLSDIFGLVRKRGIFMQEAYPVGGAMTAVLGLSAESVEEVCEKTPGQVSVANYNCPGQLVITGEETAVRLAEQELAKAGAKRCIPLKVSGPFHSPLLNGAAGKLEEELKVITVSDIKVPYLSNVTGDYVTQKEQIKELLTSQVASSVRWQQCVERMLASGVDTFIEMGPGRTLTGFVRKIDRTVKAVNIEKTEDLENILWT